MTKQKYIERYITRKMKGHGLPYGMQYLNLLAKTEEDAEKQWRVYRRKIKVKGLFISRSFGKFKN